MNVYSEAEFLKMFRFGKLVVRDILLPLFNNERVTNRGLPVPAAIYLVLTLRFYQP